jgi:ectoine hydroxylase-related dioxygenase (phytanoyl-CoA dioxygenase family)
LTSEEKVEYKSGFWKFRKENYDPNMISLIKKMGDITKDLFQNENVYLLNEQYLIKPPNNSNNHHQKDVFAIHQDSQHLPMKLREIPLISCWLAIDDITEINGGLVMIDLESNKETLMKINKGDVIFINGNTFHYSKSNNSKKFRRAFMPQFISLQSAKTITSYDFTNIGIIAKV